MMTGEEFRKRLCALLAEPRGMDWDALNQLQKDALRSMSLYGDTVTRKIAAAWLARLDEMGDAV